MDTRFFSLDTAIGTARAIVYWDRLSEQQKANILLTAGHPDVQLLEIVLQEGNPLLIEIALSGTLAWSFRRTPVSGAADLIPKALEAIEGQWKKRLGFTSSSVGQCPLNLASDFYTWMRGDSTEGPCAPIEAWANQFCLQSQLQRKLEMESTHFYAAVGILAACLRKGKLSCPEAYDLFKVVIARHSTRYEDEEWCFTWDDGLVLASFLSAMAIADDKSIHESRSLLAGSISALPKFVILEESVEPFLAMNPRSLTLMLLMRGRAHCALKVLRRRLVELAQRGDKNAFPPSVRLGILCSDDGWEELLSLCSKRSEALRFALDAPPIPEQLQDWGIGFPKDYWLRCGMGLLSFKSGHEWLENLDRLDAKQRKIELAEMACLCEAMVTSGGQGWYVDSYQDCDFARNSYDYSQDGAVVSGDIVSTYENLLRRDPYGRRGGQWRKWRIHMDRKYGLTERLVASA